MAVDPIDYPKNDSDILVEKRNGNNFKIKPIDRSQMICRTNHTHINRRHCWIRHVGTLQLELRIEPPGDCKSHVARSEKVHNTSTQIVEDFLELQGKIGEIQYPTSGFRLFGRNII